MTDPALVEALLAPVETEPGRPRERLRQAVAELDAALAAVDAIETPPDPISSMLAAKQARKRALADALTGRTSRPRDERGRFTASLDGGARRTPERRETQGEMLMRVLASGEADVGASL